MPSIDFVYPLESARALALAAQNLHGSTGEDSGQSDEELIYKIIARLGCVQIDTIQIVERSQYLVLWSRLGNYRKSNLNRLIYDPNNRRLFEGLQHAACLIPVEDYRYQLPGMHSVKQKHLEPNHWLAKPENQALCRLVYERIKEEGPLRARDFEYDGPKRSGWWDWKPAKNALEYLTARGDLMITDRINFQRVYDLRERVLPRWVVLDQPTVEERDRYWLEQGVKALGICQPMQAAGYSYSTRVRSITQDLIDEGVFVEIKVYICNGSTASFIVHRDNLELLTKATAGEILTRRTTFLSPFDNLFWARGRDEQLWNFRNLLEAYKPAPTREWGYFNMPVLHHDRLIGRIDPKMDRKHARLIVRGFYLEPGVKLEQELIMDLALAFRSFMGFHQAKELVFERDEDARLGARIMAQLY
ncbi:MAG: winged helix-turn-helix domain-containing protein [Anaerolineales bacterium]|jgi:hypothetical protein